jgi:hypothetical protein
MSVSPSFLYHHITHGTFTVREIDCSKINLEHAIQLLHERTRCPYPSFFGWSRQQNLPKFGILWSRFISLFPNECL